MGIPWEYNILLCECGKRPNDTQKHLGNPVDQLMIIIWSNRQNLWVSMAKSIHFFTVSAIFLPRIQFSQFISYCIKLVYTWNIYFPFGVFFFLSHWSKFSINRYCPRAFSCHFLKAMPSYRRKKKKRVGSLNNLLTSSRSLSSKKYDSNIYGDFAWEYLRGHRHAKKKSLCEHRNSTPVS